MKTIAVIGGGPAGMMAAGTAASQGHNVHLFEKNNRLGKKLHITGKGRCNITNAADVDTYLSNIVTNPYFLYSATYAFDCFQTIEFFENLGVKTKVERGNRVFPASDKASDVVRAMEKFVTKNGVKVHLSSVVKGIESENNHLTGISVETESGKKSIFKCDSVIIATGGLSYPATGSTGDGYRFAKATGHNVTKLYPSLAPLITAEAFVARLQGLSLKNIGLTVTVGGKKIYKDFGEMLFTHFGISGPIILSASAHLHRKIHLNPVVSIDLKPALNENELDKRLIRDFEKYINKDFKNSLDDLLPQKLIPVFIELSGIPADKKIHDITKAERRKIVSLLKGLTVTITDLAGFNEAIITKGGVDVDFIDPSTMESKILPGLIFAGEVIDVDGFTGGFNLQIAFSTGYLAGISI